MHSNAQHLVCAPLGTSKPTLEMIKNFLQLVLVTFFLSGSSCQNIVHSVEEYSINSSKVASEVIIYRDVYGVPHIYGPTDESVVFGFAYARAEDRFQKLEDHYIQVIGRLSEVKGEKGRTNDLKVKAFEIERLAKVEYQNLTPKIKRLCDAYAAGLNYYLLKNPETRPKLIVKFEPWYILAEYKSMVFPAMGEDRKIAEYLENSIESIGSNAWAIGPGKTKSGNPMLVANPHLDLHEPYEVQLVSELGLNFFGTVSYGAGILPIIGHNQNLGWSLTANRPDIVDEFEIHFDHPTDSNLYRFGKKYLPLERWTDTLLIKTSEGYKKEVLHLKKTIHGPIVTKSEKGIPLSTRIAGIEKGGMLEQVYMMCKASDLQAFQSALKLNSLLVMAITYADKEGNIFYLHNGTIPKRDTTFNWRLAVDGSDTASLWKGYHSLGELPQLVNPTCQYVQNCNNLPFTTTTQENPNPNDFPSYMTYHQSNTQRGERSRFILDTLQNSTMESLIALKFDTYIHTADKWIRELEEEMEMVAKIDPERIKKISTPLQFIKSWDKHSRASSAETTLFYIWTFKRFHQRRTGAEYPNLIAFEESIDKLMKEKGSWKVPWGEVYRLQRLEDNTQYSVNSELPSFSIDGGIPITGIMFASSAAFDPSLPDIGLKELNMRAHFGDAYVSIVEFGDTVKAKSIIPYGISDHPESAHFSDQSVLYSRGELKPVFFSKEEVLANLKTKYYPGEKKWK